MQDKSESDLWAVKAIDSLANESGYVPYFKHDTKSPQTIIPTLIHSMPESRGLAMDILLGYCGKNEILSSPEAVEFVYNYQGVSDKFSPEFNFEVVRKAADMNLTGADYRLGDLYEKGIGTAVNGANAIVVYVKGVENGSGDCCFALGRIYEDGMFAGCDLQKSIAYYNAGEQLGNIACKNKLSQGIIGKANELLKQGDYNVDALLGLSYIYTDNNKFRNAALAQKYLNQAVQLGSPAALYAQGINYENGILYPKNMFLAHKLYSDSAQKGYHPAIEKLKRPEFIEISVMYKSEMQGNPDELCQHGVYYYDGYYVEKNYEKAFEYFELAASKGSVRTSYYMGKAYENGHGVKLDVFKACDCYKNASDRNS